MKAHRRNGIPTLMLNGGGDTKTSAFGRFLRPLFTPSPEQIERDKRTAFSRDLADATAGIFTRQTPAEQVFRVPTRDLSSHLRMQIQGTLSGPRQSDYPSIIAEAYAQSLAPNIDPGIQGLLKSEYERVVLPIRQGSVAAAEAAGVPLEDDIVRQAKISEAARQEQEGLAGTATTPAETAPPPAGTAATSVAPEGPEEEAAATAATPTGTQAQAQADLARTGAQRAADALSGGVLRPQTTSAPAAAAAEQPIAIEPDDSVTGNLNSILLGEASKFDERERLKQLKETFGLNLSDMERSAPALAFSFALMGATKEPGESPLQAFIRNAGAAGQSALAQQQALDAKQRSIDAALISPILTERRAAETIERDKEWVTYWDGTTKDGLPNFKSTKMNARQIEEAQKAGINLVPLGLAGSYISNSAQVRGKAAAAELELKKLLLQEEEKRGAAIAGKTYKVGVGPDARSVREVTVLVGDDNLPNPIVFPADPATSFDRNSVAVNQTVQSVGIVRDMKKSVAEDALGLKGAVAYIYGSVKDFVGGEGFTLDETVGVLRSAGGVEGDLAWRGDPESEALLKRSMGEAYDKDLSAEDNYRRYFERTAVFANVTDDQIDKLRAEAAKAANPDERTRYEARIDYLINQRSLAAALAPLLLGESGRTISDADRIRVIQLMGEFADASKAGLFSRPKAADRILNNLESVLARNAKKFAESIQTEAGELDFASNAQVHLARPGDMAYVMTEPVKRSLDRAMLSLKAYEKLFPPSGGSNAAQNAPSSVVHAGKATELGNG